MIRNYFRVIYILIKKIVVGSTKEVLYKFLFKPPWRHPAAIRRPRDVPEGLLKVLKSETCRGLSGDSQETNTKN